MTATRFYKKISTPCLGKIRKNPENVAHAFREALYEIFSILQFHKDSIFKKNLKNEYNLG